MEGAALLKTNHYDVRSMNNPRDIALQKYLARNDEEFLENLLTRNFSILLR